MANRCSPVPWLLTLAMSLACFSARAQWQTQTLLVKPGWTAVYLHVDASYQTIDQLVGADLSNPISEIWLWRPAPSTLQFVTSPQSPTFGSSLWVNWARIGLGITSAFNTLVPNAAYLIHSTATTNYTWVLKGRPVAPTYSWTSSGLNFIDFPTPPVNPPFFDNFLSLAPSLLSAAEIYQYVGGNLGQTNPARLFAYHTTPVLRGQAFWVRAGSQYNNYFGPFQVVFAGPSGVSFGDLVSQFSLHLRNVADTNVTVSLRLLASESPPAGQSAVVGAPPLLVRGALNTSNLTYSFSYLNPGSIQTWTLPPAGQTGSDIAVVLGLNRSAITNPPGSMLAGILQFSDSFNFSEIDVPVSAQAASSAGLWVGNASINQVANYLKIYQTDVNNQPVISSNGNYIITSINTNLGAVAQSYPLRLIIHNDGSNVRLLQRVFYGIGPGSNVVVATTESALDAAHLDSARRISATHLPWSAANAPWLFSGQLVQGGTLTTSAAVAYDDQSTNPFLHTYHPDHDNLNATFSTELPQGSESYQISRQISLSISPPGSDFASLTSASQTLYGTYSEAITLGGLAGATRMFNVSGVFALNRISTIAALTTH